MTLAASLGDLAGSLRVSPGAPMPDALQSSRPDWASRAGRGQPVAALPGLMASLFNLCGQAHRLCSQLALGAAGVALPAAAPATAQRLRTETAQEHVRRIGLDWPRLLVEAEAASAVSARAAESLRGCPLLAAGGGMSDERWTAMEIWLSDGWLDMPAATWLRAWQACGADWLLDWSHRHQGWLAQAVRAARAADTGAPLDMARALRAHATPEGLHALAAAMRSQAGFCLQPLWQGDAAHTGNWARLATADPGLPLTPWAMLGSRVAELIRLCQPGPSNGSVASGLDCLGFGSLNTGPGEGLAWVEMARGLLVHQVACEGDGAATRVGACRVLAPTEWNFHARGEVARRMAALDPDDPGVAARVNLLMVAFDPCVPFHLGERIPREVQHA